MSLNWSVHKTREALMKKEIIDAASLRLEEVSMKEIPLREEEEGDIIICQCVF